MLDILKKASKPADDFDYIKERTVRKFPMLGVTMSKLNYVANDSIGTAGTDGKIVYYAPRFFKTLTDDEKVFVLAHEVLHVAFDHVLRCKDRDKKLWNKATDAVINQILQHENLPMIEGVVDMKEAAQKSAEDMYEQLLKERTDKKEKEKQEQHEEPSDMSKDKQQGADKDNTRAQSDKTDQEDTQSKSQKAGDSDSKADDLDDENTQVGHDNHDLWEKAVQEADKNKERTAQQQTQPNGMPDNGLNESQVNPQEQGCNQSQGQTGTQDQSNASTQLTESQEAASDWNRLEKTFAEDNRRQRAEMARQIREQLQDKKTAFATAGEGKSLGEVGESKSVLDWKKVLKKTLEDEEDRWSYRRSGADNDYMARVETLEDEKRGETQVLLDTSGSVNAPMLREFLRQLKPLLKTSKLYVGCFDTRFYGFKEIKTKQDIDNFMIHGGGGTDLDLAAKSFGNGKDINKIVFTDGIPGTMPTPQTKHINVIWLVYGNKNFNPVCGKVIQVDKSTVMNRFLNANVITKGRG